MDDKKEVLSGATDLYKTYESCMLKIAQERIDELNEKLADYEKCIEGIIEQERFKGYPMPHEWGDIVSRSKEVLAKYKSE